MPWSRHVPHFNAKALGAALASQEIDYVPLGRELGGRPAGNEFYDEQGHVLYGRLATSPAFQDGLDQVLAPGPVVPHRPALRQRRIPPGATATCSSGGYCGSAAGACPTSGATGASRLRRTWPPATLNPASSATIPSHHESCPGPGRKVRRFRSPGRLGGPDHLVVLCPGRAGRGRHLDAHHSAGTRRLTTCPVPVRARSWCRRARSPSATSKPRDTAGPRPGAPGHTPSTSASMSRSPGGKRGRRALAGCRAATRDRDHADAAAAAAGLGLSARALWRTRTTGHPTTGHAPRGTAPRGTAPRGTAPAGPRAAGYCA